MSSTIAVIDDDRQVLEAIAMFLELAGWHVVTFLTGESFLAELPALAPQLSCAIVDPHLPGVSGAVVARALASSQPVVPFIGMTARPESQVASDLGSAGARVILIKPVAPTMLLQAVAEAVDEGHGPNETG